MAGTVHSSLFLLFVSYFATSTGLPIDSALPIRVNIQWTHGVRDQLGGNISDQWHRYLTTTILRLSQVFRVNKTATPLILQRTNGPCSEFNATNATQCIRLNASYDGETCPGLTTFRIPNPLLEGLSIYGSNSTSVAFEEGSGIADTDLIVFITAENTISCRQKITYTVGHYCRLNRGNNRPLASTINICPGIKDTVDWSRAFTSVVRSLLHALGFDLPLLRSRIDDFYFHNIDGRLFLKSPNVLTFSNLHFNCNNGVPFSRNSSNLWDPIFMHTSVLAGYSTGPAAGTVIDGATVAALEDTGWYSVDFKKVDIFLWGFQRGCKFDQDCTDTRFFCPRPGSSRSYFFHYCDFLHQGKTECPVLDPERPQCRIRSLGKTCSKNSKASFRCFGIGAHTSSECINVYCNNRKTMFGVIFKGTVGFCTATRPFIYLGKLKIICPKKELICIKPETLANWMPNVDDLHPVLTTSAPQERKSSFEMRFASMSYQKIQFLGVVGQLGVLLIKKLAGVLKCNENAITVTSVRSGSVIVGFQVLHTESPDTLFTMLQDAVKAGKILVTVGGETYTASTVVNSDNGESMEPHAPGSTPITEIIMGAVFGVLLCAATASVAAIFIIKYKIVKPQVSPQPPQEMNPSRPRSLETATIGSRQTSMTMTEVERPFSASSAYFDSLENMDSTMDRSRRYEVSEA